MADIKINAFGKTDVGLMRTINQDSIFVSTQPIGKLPNLFIVADGMGGCLLYTSYVDKVEGKLYDNEELYENNEE